MNICKKKIWFIIILLGNKKHKLEQNPFVIRKEKLLHLFEINIVQVLLTYEKELQLCYWGR